MKFIKLSRSLTWIILLVLIFAVDSYGEKEEGGNKDASAAKGPPPALVVVAEVKSGEVEPMAEFVGTVFYARVSRVAAELSGIVEKIKIEEGQRVKAGQTLVQLNTDLLDTAIDGTRASHEQALVDLEKAEKDLKRTATLYKDKSVSEAVYDEQFYRHKSLGKKAASLKSSLERLLLEKKKKIVPAPFSGIVVEKSTEKGEWIATGGTVAVVADDSEIDMVLSLPAEMLRYLDKGREIEIDSNGVKLQGRFTSFVPRGDVATRTFSVKLRLQNTAGLIEGMEAKALVPTGRKSAAMLVPRDAVINKFGKSVVFLVVDSKAKMLPIELVGYDGMLAGVSGLGDAVGQQVVVKGNERLQDGQPVMISE